MPSALEPTGKMTFEAFSSERENKRHQGLSHHCDAALVELVHKTWGRELDLYGYSFDGLDLPSAQLHNKVDQRIRQSIFDWI